MKLLSIQTGTRQPLQIDNQAILSGIRKKPLPEQNSIQITKLGLEGDQQADLSVHGGLSKAVYAFPSEHYPYWQKVAANNGIKVPLMFGFMGENLTIEGLDETDAYVGDELHFSNCVLRITQPRQPCFKFNAIMNSRKASILMAQTGFSGFYLSVVETGTIQTGETFSLVPGSRSTSISSLSRVSKLKTRND